MTDADIAEALEAWADILADDNYLLSVGHDSDGPVIVFIAVVQGNVIRWLL